MSRPSRSTKKKIVDEDEEEEEVMPKSAKSKSSPLVTSSAASTKTSKGNKAATNIEDDDFPKLDFDMGSLEDDLDDSSAPPVGSSSSSSSSTKLRFPVRPPVKATVSNPNSRSGSRHGSRRSSPERQHFVKMEELDRWRWSSKYADEGDQDEIRLAANMHAWSQVQLPDQDTVDVAATMMFRKFLWKNKKLCRNGIPPQYRLFVWELLSGARTMPDRMEHLNRYQYYLTQFHHLTSKQQREINADIPRVLGSHPKFAKSKEGAEELRNVLSAFAVRSPNIGYVNSLSHIAAYFLLYYQAESAFWILCAIVDIVLPPDYFSQSLLGVRAECMLLRILVFQRLPKLHAHFMELGVDVYNIALKWLMTLYLLCLSKEVVARIFDVLFLEGSNILVSVGLSFFITHERELLKIDDLMEMLDVIAKLGNEITNNDELMRTLLKESKCKIGEEEEKRRQIERTVMENDYMKELQKTQLHRKQEEARLKEAAEATAKREREEVEAVGLGFDMYKVGHWGEPRQTHVALEQIGGEWFVTWRSKRKKDEQAQMKIAECTLHFGLRHGNFVTRPEFATKFKTSRKLAFSLCSPQRSLDLVCQSSMDMDAWKKIFFRSNFPVKNVQAVQRFRRRLEKKKTLKRSALAAVGKSSYGKIESSDEDYDYSDSTLTSEDEEQPKSNGSSLSSALGKPSASSSSSSSAFSSKDRSSASSKRSGAVSSALRDRERDRATTSEKNLPFRRKSRKDEDEQEEEDE